MRIKIKVLRLKKNIDYLSNEYQNSYDILIESIEKIEE